MSRVKSRYVRRVELFLIRNAGYGSVPLGLRCQRVVYPHV